MLLLLFANALSVEARLSHGGISADLHPAAGSSPFHYPRRVRASGWKVVARGQFSDCTWQRVDYAGDHDETPALLIEPLSASAEHRAPILMMIHGLGGRKEDLLPVARLAAQDGYASLLIDLPDSGDRKPAVGPSFPTVSAFTDYVDAGLVESVDDLGVGLDYLSLRPELDSDRVGVLGVSLGSFVAADFAGTDRRVKIALLIASGGGLGEILTYQRLASQSAGGENQSLLAHTDAQALDRTLAPVDPLTYIARIAPRPLLMVNGAEDQIIPPSAAQRLFGAAREPKEIDWFPGEGHVPSPLGIYASITVFLRAKMPA